MREIIIIETNNSNFVKSILDNNNLTYKLYQEPLTAQTKKKELIEQYKKSSRADWGIFEDFENSAINDLDK